MGKPVCLAPKEAIDWLWYKPDVDIYIPMGQRLWHCWKCDVTWKQLYEPREGLRIRCWCCGQFQKLPKI